MKHLKILNYFILGLVLAGAGAAVQAAEVGQGYLSLYVGEAEVDFDINNVNVEADDTSFRIGGGYRVSERFAVEGFFIDNGEAEDTVAGVDVSLETTALQFQVVGFLLVGGPVDLYGKLGFGIWEAEFSAPGFDDDEDGTDFAFGFGASFKLSRNLDLRAEFESVNFDDADIDTFMIGLDIGL